MLLADVFEKFISESLKFYKLDPSHYFSSPRLNWDTMLKMTGKKLEVISDIDKHLFIENRLSEGISYIWKRFSKANNKCIRNCDPTKKSKFIVYLDENKLYDRGMSQYFHHYEFKWLKKYW